MTQADLAKKMLVADKAESKWERDLSYPDIASLPKLAEILNVSVDELMQANVRTTASQSGASLTAEEKAAKESPASRIAGIVLIGLTCIALAGLRNHSY